MVLAEDQVYRLDVLAQIELDLPHHMSRREQKKAPLLSTSVKIDIYLRCGHPQEIHSSQKPIYD